MIRIDADYILLVAAITAQVLFDGRGGFCDVCCSSVSAWKMFCYLPVFVYIFFLVNQFSHVENLGIKIPLIRHKSPREAAYSVLSSSHLTQHGFDMDGMFGKPKPSNRTNDSVALYRYMDNEFYGVVEIGHKAQKFNLLFDTAWTESWVISKDCSWKTPGCSFHNKYDHLKSSTFVKNGTKYVGNEGKYNFTGYYSLDTFNVAHSRVDQQLFIEMTYVPDQFLFNKADGVVGLGLKKPGTQPFFYNLVQQGKIERPLFSIYLNRDTASIHGGNVILGFIEPKHIHQTIGPDGKVTPDQITYLPCNPSEGYWQFTIDEIILDYKNADVPNIYCKDGCSAIVDSTTNVIYGPKEDIQNIHHLIGATELFFGRYSVNCDTIENLPKLHFILNGKSFILGGPQYIQKISRSAVTFCLSTLAVPSTPSEENKWILGGSFLAHFYSVYDIDNMKIGFVMAA